MYWLTLPTETFFNQFSNYVINKKYPHKRHVFVDRDASILYVAHIDTVQDLSLPESIGIHEDRIYATGLDDRLGCYLAFRLNLLGLKGDVLICDYEEINMSTAQYFKTEKQYNWVCELDRTSNDLVFYDMNSNELENILIEENFDIGIGSFSDISMLNLPNDPCMFNLGIGYHKPHSLFSYLDIREMVDNVNRFANFYNKYKDTLFNVD